jgi:HEAT repeat protein
MSSQTSIIFPDPSRLEEIPVYDLLEAAAKAHVGIDHRWAKAILDRGERAIRDLLKFGLEDRSGDEVDLEEDLVAMFRYLGSTEAIPYLISRIKAQPEDVEDDIVEALIHLGKPVVDPLLQLYDEVGEEEGSDVAFILASLGIRDERILKLLLERLDYDAGDGAFLLGLYGDPAGRPALDKMLAEVDPEDEDLRREIVFAGEQIDAGGVREPHEEHFDFWSAYPEKAVPPADVLSEEERLEMLSSPALEYRIEAAESFRGSKMSAIVRDRLLATAKADPEPRVRDAAWRSLAEAVDEKPVREAMKRVIRDSSASMLERSGALVALAQGEEDPEVTRLIHRFYDDPETRARALEAMWRSLDREFAPIFPKHLDDPDLEVRRNAIWGVGYAGLSREAPRLEKYFEDEELRADALFAYALAMPGPVSRGRVRGMLRRIDQLATGLSMGEAELVKVALDQRLAMHGLEPVFTQEQEEDEESAEAWAAANNTLVEMPEAGPARAGRNDPCPCGSGKKYKKCCGA